MPTKKKVLITGSRSAVALDLARQFYAVDCDVYLADSMPNIIGQYSNSIKKFFCLSSPRYNKHQFIDELIAIVKKYNIDLLVPTFEETYYIAQYHLQHPITECEVFCAPFETIHHLHHKLRFQQRLTELNIAAIPTKIIKSNAELKRLDFPQPYILKACYSRASLAFYKIDVDSKLPTLNFSAKQQWIAQTWLNGKKYCSYSVCQRGKILAHCAYPVQIAIGGNSCVMFEAICHPEIFNWVQHFVAHEQYTGQIAFDFIETNDGQLYAIECNPRATSGVHLFEREDKLATAFLNHRQPLIKPELGRRRQIAMGMLLYGWQPNASRNISDYLNAFCSSSDVIFDRHDLKPFFMQPFVFFYLIRLARKLNLSLPGAFNYDLEWNG